jgi:hypothetical protein
LSKLSENQLPQQCPSCQQELQVDQLHCPSCETEVFGNFKLPFMARLTGEEQEFIKEFILHSGSLKAMAQQLNQSYPTVRAYLDDLITKLQQLEGENSQQYHNPNS